MGLWSSIRALFSADEPVHTFAASIDGVIDANDVAALFPGYTTDWVAVAWKVTRPAAMQCGAVVRARDAIAGTIGGLPLYAMDSSFERSPRPLLEQPERDIPRSITMTRTAEDLLFGTDAWWRVTERDYTGYPAKVRRLDPDSVDIRQDSRVYVRPDGTPQGHAMEYVPDADLIRFYSPTDGLLTSAARAIRTLLKLEAAAANDADSPQPRGFFYPREGVDPAPVPTVDDPNPDADTAVAEMLAAYKAARQAGVDGYMPAALGYEKLSWSPAERQMVEARNAAVLEIARFTGLDPFDLAASTTGQASMTYQNLADKRRQFIDGACGLYIAAIQDRLSMGDVTPRGTLVRLDVAQYERADMSGRLEEYQAMQDLGLMDSIEMRRREELPKPTEPRPAPAAQPAGPGRPQLRAVAASGDEAALTFDGADQLVLGFASDPVEVDFERRTIRGLAVPWGKVAKKNGQRFRFSRGTVRWTEVTRVKALAEHVRSSAFGKAIELTEDARGLWTVLKVDRTAEGDRALAKAADGTWDGLSIGLLDDSRFALAADGVHDAVDALLAEISLTPFPAFDDARVSGVAASADDPTGGTAVKCTKCGQDHAPGTPCATPAPDPATGSITFSQDQFEALLARFGNPQEGPERIRAVPAGTAQVREQPLYRFDGRRGQYDFSTDLQAMAMRDSEATQRIEQFMSATFDTDQADVNELNPVTNRPDLYVDNLQFEYPVSTAIRKGSLDNNTGFTIPAWASASGLVADHVEATEPSLGTFTTTKVDVTPKAKSGKVSITREVWDQGGNPALSMLIWREITRAWNEALEVEAVACLDALTPTAIALSGSDADLDGQITTALAALQFIRGGFRMRDMPLAQNLFTALVTAVDDDGRKLFPLLGPANAGGTVSEYWASLQIGGLLGKPAWALEAANGGDGSSYLFNREDVHLWATPPRRIDMPNVEVRYVHIGVWGYVATACTRLSGVRELTYSA